MIVVFMSVLVRSCSVHVLALLCMHSGYAHAGEPLRVEAKVSRDVYYVGQAIEVRVGVVAGGERPRVTPPKVDGAEVAVIDTAFRQVATSGIGDVVTETNVFLSRFRVMPLRAGTLSIPPFRARLDDRSGASESIRLTVRPVPAEGRPASYLRGVGGIEARAEAVPASVRVGQAFEYRLVLNGPGARGSTQWPLLHELGQVPGLKLETGTTDLTADPPRRTFRFRARPTEPGELILPAVAVATFDPTLKRYIETRAPGVSIRVVDVPRFDPASLPLMSAEPSPGPRFPGGVATWVALVLIAATTIAVLARVRGRAGPRRLARRLAADLASEQPGEIADRVASAMTLYLERTIGRPRGEITPGEAGPAIAMATRDRTLADRAVRLIGRCDAARFGSDEASRADLRAEASAFFRDLSRRRVRPS